MTHATWLAILQRQAATIGWDEIVTGHDFGFLKPAEIQDWILERGFEDAASLYLAAMEGDPPPHFEAALWAAAAAATGKAPRPGGVRWSRAQDRWRSALLADALDASLSAEALAIVVETVYDHTGCPEDMLGLWNHPSPWRRVPAVADPAAVAAFVARLAPERLPMASVA